MELFWSKKEEAFIKCAPTPIKLLLVFRDSLQFNSKSKHDKGFEKKNKKKVIAMTQQLKPEIASSNCCVSIYYRHVL